MTRIASMVRGARKLVVDNAPAILTGMAVAGVVTTTVFAVKATPRAIMDIQHAESEFVDPLTPMQKVQLTYRYYLPAAAMGGMTIACIICANSIHSKRQAALMSAYSFTETAFREYQTKVTEAMGTTKEQRVRDDIAQDRVNQDPVSTREVIITGNGDVLCYDSLTARYFNSNVENLRRAQNDINAQIINDMSASQNDFYRLIGLPVTAQGDEMGWNNDKMLELSFSSVMSEDGRPCLSLNYRVSPMRGYDRFH